MTQCQHREWLESDEHFATGERCTAPAEFITCDQEAACAAHKCRCARPFLEPQPTGEN